MFLGCNLLPLQVLILYMFRHNIILGYKKEESECLLKFLYDQVALSHDCQVRVRWEPGTVVVFDVSKIHTLFVKLLTSEDRIEPFAIQQSLISWM